MNISIDYERCIRCGRCAKVCPSLVFGQQKQSADMQVVAPENCIVCGHCVAACPVSAVAHTDFPPEKVHPVDRTQLPTPEQLLLLCKARRSNRALSRKPVPQEYVNRILEAAHAAPTASNLQQVGYTVLTTRPTCALSWSIRSASAAKCCGCSKCRCWDGLSVCS